MTAKFPFRDGQRFMIDDDQFHAHTVICRHTKAKAAARGTRRVMASYSLTTAGGLPVVFLPNTRTFRIPILGCFATRRV